MTKHSPFRYYKTSPEVTPLSYSCPLKAQQGWVCGVLLSVWELQERHVYTRTNFKLNRAAALTEWLSAATAMPLVNATTGVGMIAVVAECDQH